MERESKIVQSVMMQWRDIKEAKRLRGEKIAKVMEKVVILKDGFHSLKEYIGSVDEIQK